MYVSQETGIFQKRKKEEASWRNQADQAPQRQHSFLEFADMPKEQK